MTEAERITRALRGKWYGYYGLASCPAHDDRNPSLSLADGASGRLLANCKAGCDFLAVLGALRGLGVIEGVGTVPRTDPLELARHADRQRREVEKRQRRAQAIWTGAVPIRGTIAETYLRDARGIKCPLPDSLRFHSTCWHPSAGRLPTMIALVQGPAGFAVHRTYLREDGRGKAGVRPGKAILGPTAGSAVRLASGHEALAVAEGLETALSLLCGPLSGSVAVWAALSTSGMAGLQLPARPGQLIIGADGDPAGRTAATKLAERATALGWSVDIFPAPDGRDWNDVIQDMKGAAT